MNRQFQSTIYIYMCTFNITYLHTLILEKVIAFTLPGSHSCRKRKVTFYSCISLDFDCRLLLAMHKTYFPHKPRGWLYKIKDIVYIERTFSWKIFSEAREIFYRDKFSTRYTISYIYSLYRWFKKKILQLEMAYFTYSMTRCTSLSLMIFFIYLLTLLIWVTTIH